MLTFSALLDSGRYNREHTDSYLWQTWTDVCNYLMNANSDILESVLPIGAFQEAINPWRTCHRVTVVVL